MGDLRFQHQYERVQQAASPTAALARMSDEEVVAALAGASTARDAYLANVLATEAMNRARAKETIVNIAGEGLVALHVDGTVRFLNPAAEAALGMRHDDAMGVNFHETVHRELDGRATPWLTCAVCTEVMHRGLALRNVEALFLRRDGTLMPVLLTASPILRGGEVEGAILAFRDVTEQHESRRRLLESEERYRSLFVHNPDAVYSFDLEGNFLSANPALERLSGYTIPELLRVTFLPLVDPADRDAVARHFREAARGTPQTYEATLLKRDGTRARVEVTNVPMSAGGRIVGVYGIAKDVTPRAQAEEALRYHSSLLQAQNEASPDGILVVDREGRMVAHNRRLVEMWGFPEEVVRAGDDAAALAHARGMVADPNAFMRGVREGYDSGAASTRDEILLKDGRVLERHGARVTDGKRSYGWVWTFRDVTERTRAVEALRQSEERLRLLVESARDHALYMLDAEGRVASWNAGAQRLLGYGVDEAVGLHFSAFFPEDARGSDAPGALLRRAREAGRHEEEGWRVRKDGTRFWAHVLVTPVSDRAGRHVGFVKVTRDLTERKRVEDTLRESAARFRGLYDNLPSMYFTLGLDGTILSANRYGARYLGYEPAELEGRSVLDLAHPDDREKVRERLVAFARDRPAAGQWEFRKLSKEGAVLWVSDTVRLARDPGGREVILNVCDDVTERRRHEETLQRVWADAPPATDPG